MNCIKIYFSFKMGYVLAHELITYTPQTSQTFRNRGSSQHLYHPGTAYISYPHVYMYIYCIYIVYILYIFCIYIYIVYDICMYFSTYMYHIYITYITIYIHIKEWFIATYRDITPQKIYQHHRWDSTNILGIQSLLVEVWQTPNVYLYVYIIWYIYIYILFDMYIYIYTMNLL